MLVDAIVSVTELNPTSLFAVPALITKLNACVGVLVVFVNLKKLLLELAVTFAIPAEVILFTISASVKVLKTVELCVVTTVLFVIVTVGLAIRYVFVAVIY